MYDINIFREKNRILSKYAKEVSPEEFYRDMFPVGSFEEKGHPEQKKANGILCDIKNGRGKHSIVFDDLEEIKEHLENDFVIISPVAYFGKRRTANNASMLYGFCFDLDGVEVEQLQQIMDWLENPHFPRATYISNSGAGLHLYYLLEQPIPLYKSIHKKLSTFKHELTDLIWNKYTSTIDIKKRQYQGIFQGFRMVGTKTKCDDIVRVFHTGFKIDIEYLNRFVKPEAQIHNINYESALSLEEAMSKYPVWYEKRITNKEKKGRWHIKRDLYDWWLNKIQTDPNLSVGHRYFCIAVLASYAAKCDIGEDELRKDAYGLKHFMNSLKDDFSDDDIESALNFYQESFITLPRDEVVKISGLEIPTNKRNGRSQEKHLQGARAIRDINNPNWREGNGRKPKKDIVIEWRKNNPNGKKIDCSRDTGLHINTVYKWWS